jgi:stalled ribosome rescue protein Dom34
MTNLTISYYLDKLLIDASFVDQLETALENIIQNEKIDASNIPEIINTIFQIIQKNTTIIINSKFLNETIQKLVEFLVRKYNINISDAEMSVINEVVKTSLTLLFTSPILKGKGCCC